MRILTTLLLLTLLCCAPALHEDAGTADAGPELEDAGRDAGTASPCGPIPDMTPSLQTGTQCPRADALCGSCPTPNACLPFCSVPPDGGRRLTQCFECVGTTWLAKGIDCFPCP